MLIVFWVLKKVFKVFSSIFRSADQHLKEGKYSKLVENASNHWKKEVYFEFKSFIVIFYPPAFYLWLEVAVHVNIRRMQSSSRL